MGTESLFEPVSIVIPVKNRRSLISDLIQNLLHVDYPNFEIIFVDDGSTDGTLELLGNFR